MDYKTNLLFSAFLSKPVSVDSNYLYNYPDFHSPYTIREGFPVYRPLAYNLPDSRSYFYAAGAEIIAFHNFSPLFGISGFINYAFGNSASGENSNTFSSVAQLRYNILSKLYFTANLELYSTDNVKTRFSTYANFDYILF